MTVRFRVRTLRRSALALVLLAAVLVPVSGATAQTVTEPIGPPPTGTVSGTVTDPGDDPVEGVEVSIGYFDGATTTTGADGTYEVEVPVGSQVVEFIPPAGSAFAPQYWDGVYTVPDPLVVTNGADITDIDAQLAVGATISGSVADAEGDPLGGAMVWVYAWWDNPGFALSAEADVDGNYTITGIPPGNHVVAFEPPEGSDLVAEYWDDVYAPAEVDLINLALGEDVMSIDAMLSEGGAITGTVTSPWEAEPLENVYVSAESLDGSNYSETLTDEDGNYELSGLVPGAYVVAFEDEWGNFVREYYDNSFTYAGATEVVVTAATVASGIDAQLDNGGYIEGRVTGLNGVGQNGVFVEVIDSEGSPVGFSDTSGSGFYFVQGLAPGDYQVSFHAEQGTEWYDDALRQGDADLVTVANEEVTDNIDVAIDRIVFGDDFIDWFGEAEFPPSNDTRVTAQCRSIDPSSFHFEVDGFDSSDGTTSGTIDFGDGTPPFVFDSSGDMVDHTFPWPGGTSTGDPVEVEVSLSGGPDYIDSFTIVTGSTGCLGPGEPTFIDVPASHPFFDEIECLVDLGVTEGFPDGTFRPANDITRQAVVAWLWRLAGEPAPTGPPEFTDVPPGHPFEDPIAWATEEGIVAGYPDDTFRPGNPVTREAVAAFLWRFAGEQPPAGEADFTDVGADATFHDAIAWLQEQGIVTGFADGTFRPANDITRQAVAAWVCRFSDVPMG